MIAAYYCLTVLEQSYIITSNDINMLMRLLKRADIYFDFIIINIFPQNLEKNTEEVVASKYYRQVNGDLVQGLITISREHALILANERAQFNYIENKR